MRVKWNWSLPPTNPNVTLTITIMSTAKIRVTIDPLGNPTVKGEGFIGSACVAGMKPIEDVFAGGVASSTDHPEAHMIVEETENEIATL